MSENTTNDVAVIDEATTHASTVDISAAISDFQSGNMPIATSIKGDDFKSKVAVAKAMSNSVGIAEHLNKEIKLRHYLVHPVEMADEKTGELRAVPRVVLIADDGNAYHAISEAIFNRLQTYIRVLGDPDTWDEAVGVKVTHEKGNNGFKFYNLSFA